MSVADQDHPKVNSNNTKLKPSWSLGKYDDGLKLLKDRREKITNAGKYSDRYKGIFTHDKNNEPKTPSSSERFRTNPLDSKKMEKSKAKPSPSATKPPPGQIGGLLRKHVNIYNVTTPPEKPAGTSESPRPTKQKVSLNLILNDQDKEESTLGHLDHVQNMINQLNKKEKELKNLKKFDELVKKVKNVEPEKVLKEKSQDFHDTLHILNPIKHCNDVDNLQVKDLRLIDENEEQGQFERNVTERKSLTVEKKKKGGQPPILDRTASDAKDREVKIKPRFIGKRTPLIGKVLF